ncbi:MAG: glycosyltransferase family 2 protein [Planctomycetes bacterium]|jgi:glycosyltransferase involved in cell wall biosynthesis|nr:glycosyltransferase family 2 protein [Planctomycetota bacterium]
MTRATTVELSIVVPIFNEAPNLRALHGEISQALASVGRESEILYVDDRSTDGSLELLLELRALDPRVRVIRFRRNFGQTAALAAGFEHSRGRVVVTLDGDLQNDPADIPALLAEIDRGCDVVAGWRKRRHDGLLLRRIPSWIANRLISLATGVRVHDTGCTLKAFRRDLVQRLAIYSEQHRFLPALALGSGARVRELEVNHRPRLAGVSKYGIGRASKVLLDLLVILLISRFGTRPLHYFGLLSLFCTGGAVVFLAMSTIDWKTFTVVDKWIQFSLFVFFMLLLLVTYFVLLGLLSELAVTASGTHRRRVFDRLLIRSH